MPQITAEKVSKALTRFIVMALELWRGLKYVRVEVI
jgi:hypothetical protein